MSALYGEGILVFVHSFVHSGSGVEFAVKFVIKGFDLASRIKSRNPLLKNLHSPNGFHCLKDFSLPRTLLEARRFLEPLTFLPSRKAFD